MNPDESKEGGTIGEKGLRDRTIRLVRDFKPGPDGAEKSAKERILDLLEETEAPFCREQFDPGHLTASALVLAPEGNQVLLVKHLKLDRWLQPGGHTEPGDHSPQETAAREAAEETGVKIDPESKGVLVCLDVHPIPRSEREPAHEHFDLMFRFSTNNKRIAPSEEVGGVVWCRSEDLGQYQIDGPLLKGLSRSGWNTA